MFQNVCSGYLIYMCVNTKSDINVVIQISCLGLTTCKLIQLADLHIGGRHTSADIIPLCAKCADVIKFQMCISRDNGFSNTLHIRNCDTLARNKFKTSLSYYYVSKRFFSINILISISENQSVLFMLSSTSFRWLWSAFAYPQRLDGQLSVCLRETFTGFAWEGFYKVSEL